MVSHIKKSKPEHRRGLGSIGSKLLSELSAEAKMIFTIKDAEITLGTKGSSLRKLIHGLKKNKWIESIERGRYIILPLESGWGANFSTNPLIICRKLVEPYYVGFGSALNYYGITEQVSRTTFMVTTKKKKSFRFHAQDYYFVSLAKNRFFGFTQEWIGNLKFNISDKEKTIIDCLFIPKYSGGLTEIVKAFREKLDHKKLYEYALKMEDLATLKRLGYLFDILKINTPFKEKLLLKVSGGYCLFDTGGPKAGAKNTKWMVIENIGREQLLVEI